MADWQSAMGWCGGHLCEGGGAQWSTKLTVYRLQGSGKTGRGLGMKDSLLHVQLPNYIAIMAETAMIVSFAFSFTGWSLTPWSP